METAWNISAALANFKELTADTKGFDGEVFANKTIVYSKKKKEKVKHQINFDVLHFSVDLSVRSSF